MKRGGRYLQGVRVEIRETGSIRVSADKDRVLDVLRTHVRGADVHGDRVDAPGGAYVVREGSDGTHVYHLRRERTGVATAQREREVLRQAVKADLFELRRMLEISRR